MRSMVEGANSKRTQYPLPRPSGGPPPPLLRAGEDE
jgi:hypothetical protein